MQKIEGKIDIAKMPKLGFGIMRLPQKDGMIDLEATTALVDRYMEAGFHYFDTAYIYHGGKSEWALKKALTERYDRESYYLADKLPSWCMQSAADRDKIFEEQLERCGVSYFDFYLLHSVEEGAHYETYTKYDCFNWGFQKKKEGKIRHFGFSFHGSPSLLEKILDQYSEIEFVQIQLNYMDWNNQLVESGKLYEILKERNIPMVIMEPVKGGNLARLPEDVSGILKEIRPELSQASWAFRFVASLPGIMTVLSGMTTMEQMEDNLKTFQNFEPLSEKEKEALDRIVKKVQDMPLVPCTACEYCCDGCPMKISRSVCAGSSPSF